MKVPLQRKYKNTCTADALTIKSPPEPSGALMVCGRDGSRVDNVEEPN